MSWSSAYAVQAKSDLEAREQLLANPQLPECHHLHFLQMAAEKLCKAYLAKRGTLAKDLRQSHAFIAKQLPAIARYYLVKKTGCRSKEDWRINAIRILARKIELLNPAVDKTVTPANCEYPWIGSDGTIVVPAEYNRFGLDDLLYNTAGCTLLKIMREAADDLSREVDNDRPASQS